MARKKYSVPKGKPRHPSEYVCHWMPPTLGPRRAPVQTTVTEIAKRLGMGRPAVSNFLNGNADLSPEMALLLEEHFGFDADKLMVMQARYDLEQARRTRDES